ncbi:biotin--[acetyl-CoA-carboxylase] ligase [Galbitalea soli]|uniref:biotin--[biotin carboxyl-carrier protein] ligase n=1 Tax=Galbitalea soli TaxID=1268042 RepID=A0A7C9TR23_9MICO|nr:biotin--[acetyl-CoA-carboxylase] ligase [Galbitalea soli]NEM91321.1 biotin--[acetyl-CoA-carboxylase] ligase [Galbitalea soli]NYJ30011.1 BirA family biotin operon repressor/biotin-[acetyl-CoA-carboxylase] ligase [Galbitalea soli]
MHLPLSSAIAARLDVVHDVASTNDVLAALVREGDVADFTVVTSTSQRAGRGRLGRAWTAPAGGMLATSILVRPRLPGAVAGAVALPTLGWLPLLAGVAVADAVRSLVGDHRTTVKWPNDVQIDGLKVAGILSELQPGADSVVVGIGLNLSLTAEQLPVPTATSLLLAGATESGDALVDLALSRMLLRLRELVDALIAAGGDARAAGLLDTVSAACGTLGQRVRVELPGGDDLVGVARSLDDSGRIVVVRESDGRPQAVAAGDVTHLRYE